MEIKEIVDKLIGNTDPVGCSSRDGKALENLKVKCELALALVQDLQWTARHKESYESSVKEIGEEAQKWLNELKEWV